MLNPLRKDWLLIGCNLFITLNPCCHWINIFFKLRTKSNSRLGHYFFSNLYGRAPKSPRGVKKSEFFFYKQNCWVLALRLTKKGRNFENLSKLKKKCQKTLFSYIFLNILQFGVKWRVNPKRHGSKILTSYRISANSFRPWIISFLE